MDFLRDGTEPTVNRQPRPNNPAAAPDARSQPSHSRYTLPNRPSARADSSSSRSSDRKRRLTTADSPMRRPSSIRMHSNNAGNSDSDPIVLDSSPLAASSRPLPPLPSPSPHGSAELERRQSDLVLPMWQPDTDVNQCPVCGRHFTFLFRKHHCRKCGRVVCAACSPHRITIPRQFIVHPPSDNPSNIIDLTGDDENALAAFGPFRNPALGGGEEVRVCNPCVPDPNFNPPPQYSVSAQSRQSHHNVSQSPSSTAPPAPPPPHPRAHRSSSSVHNASQTGGHGHTHRPRDSSSSTSDNRRVNYHGGANPRDRWLPPLPGSAHGHSSRSYHQEDSTQTHPSFSSTSIYATNMPSRSIQTPVPPPLQPQQAQPLRPRRQIPEEDECPICGNELPPKGPQNDDEERTQHISECIALHSASPAPIPLTQQTSASLPNQRTRGMSNAGASNGEGASTLNRQSHAARGMLSYIATEKDCIDDDGHEAECIICLEDFETGDRMARLVCWCKFHEVRSFIMNYIISANATQKCIKEWWEKKGRGACPTHQLQE